VLALTYMCVKSGFFYEAVCISDCMALIVSVTGE
jgi:hypothetical protein